MCVYVCVQTYAVHAAQAREGPLCHLLDAVVMDPELHQGWGQVLGHGWQEVVGDVELLQVTKRGEGPRVDLGELIMHQR